jgi:hypothetical protein
MKPHASSFLKRLGAGFLAAAAIAGTASCGAGGENNSAPGTSTSSASASVKLTASFNTLPGGAAAQDFAKYRCFRPRRASGYECYYKIYPGDKPDEGGPRYDDLPPTRGNMNAPGVIGPVSPQDLRNMGLIRTAA